MRNEPEQAMKKGLRTKTSVHEKMRAGKRRKLQENEKCGRHPDRSSHCVSPEELDVYSLPVPTLAPTESPAPTVSPSASKTIELESITRPPSSAPITQRPTFPPTRRYQEDHYVITITTKSPTFAPSRLLTLNPSSRPTDEIVTDPPTILQTQIPTSPPTQTPTSRPTQIPTNSNGPTEGSNDNLPGQVPSHLSTNSPTAPPSHAQTLEPTSSEPTNSVTVTTRPTLNDETNDSEAFFQPTIEPSISLSPEPTLSTGGEDGEGTGPRTSPTFTPTDTRADTAPASVPTPAYTVNAATAPPSISPTHDASTYYTKLPTVAPSKAATDNDANQSSEVPTSTPLFVFPTTAEPSSTEQHHESTTTCESDSEGNFGITTPLDTTGNGNNVHLVEYLYQVETTPKFEITEADLNYAILKRVEKAISDIMVGSFFPNEICVDTNTIAIQKRRQSGLLVRHRMLETTTTTNNNTHDKTAEEVIGLAADPRDRVLDGDLGVACPYPLVETDNDDMDVPPCYVVGGEMSFFMDSNNLGDVSWVDERFHADLKQAMIIGALDNVDPAIANIKYIPLGTDLLPVTDDANQTNAVTDGSNAITDGNSSPEDAKILSSTPAWSWILAGCGFIGIAIVLGMVLYRKRNANVEEEYDFDSSVGRRSTKQRGAFPMIAPVEIVDDNSEFDHDEIYKDDEEEKEEYQDIIMTGKPSSGRQVPEPHQTNDNEYSRLQINATDPNQPVVKPVLDEEAETYINNV